MGSGFVNISMESSRLLLKNYYDCSNMTTVIYFLWLSDSMGKRSGHGTQGLEVAV